LVDAATPKKTISREEVVALIRLMVSLNQRRQAEETYLLAHQTHPWWGLDKAFGEKNKK
jgi:hypothetical protein